MKKLILLLITISTLVSVSNASFPIPENNTVLTTINFEDPEEEDPAWWILIYILNFIIVVGGFFLLLRTWWRAWKKRKWWARKLIPLLILISLPTFLIGYIGYLISIALLILLGLIFLIKKLVS
jgi:hypothetical protein